MREVLNRTKKLIVPAVEVNKKKKNPFWVPFPVLFWWNSHLYSSRFLVSVITSPALMCVSFIFPLCVGFDFTSLWARSSLSLVPALIFLNIQPSSVYWPLPDSVFVPQSAHSLFCLLWSDWSPMVSNFFWNYSLGFLDLNLPLSRFSGCYIVVVWRRWLLL